MRVRVLHDHDHIPPDEPRVTVAFKGGTEVTTKRAWGDALVEAGKAEEVTPPARDDDASGG